MSWERQREYEAVKSLPSRTHAVSCRVPSQAWRLPRPGSPESAALSIGVCCKPVSPVHRSVALAGKDGVGRGTSYQSRLSPRKGGSSRHHEGLPSCLNHDTLPKEVVEHLSQSERAREKFLEVD